MKIVRAETIGNVDDYAIIESPVPTPRARELLVEVRACGMGYVDALVALGRYQVKPPTPFTPGFEIGGVVVAVGAEVSELSVGDRVMASTFGGGLAEYAIASEDSTWKLPDLLGFPAAAAFRTNYVTALHALKDRASLAKGERLLVFGAAGGVGTSAVQIGRLLGAEVIAVASTEDKRAYAASKGAHHVLDTAPEGWRERLKIVCSGGPDVIFDPVCGPLFEAAYRSQAWGGRHLVVGFAGGPIPALPVNLALMKGAALVGVDVRQFFQLEAPRARNHVDQLLEWAASGNLEPAVGRHFAFTEFKNAMTYALSGSGMGKTIIEIGGTCKE
ncbi:NADPH:quinone oxidoreductase family protein [Tardiphaga sp. 215_C5_N2_1]|uniref:NADPH:quinone oxidoreductase family protein n=1 Tax=Tardiphaga sp. 215_C5_N2_1 TaxID=3240774 RepID=UPI003F8B4A8F